MKRDALVETVVTGSAWMGSGTRAINTALHELVAGTTRELHVVTYAISDGADDFIDALEALLRNGVRILFVVDRLEAQFGTTPERLRHLGNAYAGQFSLYEFVTADPASLHAKCVISDRSLALIGSANLSFNGLFRNHELAVVIEGDAAADLASVVDRLTCAIYVRPV